MPPTPQQPLRVAIVAENASFRFGGEASLPLHYFSRLRQRGIEAWLIVHSRTRLELDTLFPNDTHRILSIPDRWFHKLLWTLGKPLPRRVSGATFGLLMELANQHLARRLVLDLIRTQGINLVHQPTPVSPKAPSLLAHLGVPVVFGPMNGGMDYPTAFRSDESRFTHITVALGRRAANLVNQLIPGKKYADILLVANPRTRLALPACVTGTILEIPENGVDLTLWTLPREAPANPTPNFIFIGRLVDWKRLDIVLHALTKLPQATLEVIGDGPMRPAWTTLAESLNLAPRVHFLGWLPQQDCALHLQRATALLLPSVYECGGAVVLEALATATPVIATAWGGPNDYLDQNCGILVQPSSTQALIHGFAEAMQRLAADPALRQRLGHFGRQRVEQQYDWNKKLDQILAVYQQALSTRTALESTQPHA